MGFFPADPPRDDVDIIDDFRTALARRSGRAVVISRRLADELDGLLDRVKRVGKQGRKPKTQAHLKIDALIIRLAEDRKDELVEQGLSRIQAELQAADEATERYNRLSATAIKYALGRKARTTKRVRPRRKRAQPRI